MCSGQLEKQGTGNGNENLHKSSIFVSNIQLKQHTFGHNISVFTMYVQRQSIDDNHQARSQDGGYMDV